MTSEVATTSQTEISPLCWEYDAAVEERSRYMSPSLETFQAYTQLLMLRRGRDQYLWDQAGKQYLDCIGQNVCISVGHCNPVVNAAVRAQMEELVHCTTMWMHPAPGALARSLVEHLPDETDWVIHLVNSGSEALDLAVLLARVHTGSHDMIALQRSYHGLHFSAQALSGLAIARQPIAGPGGFFHVSVPDQYRGVHGPGVEPYIADFSATVEASTSGRIAGFVYEPIQGFGGVTPLPCEYVEAVAPLVRDAGGLMIADEVQTGFGRTGEHFWGFEAFGVVPDIVCMAKGIGNGYPLAAVAVRREVADAMTTRKFFNTYGANPTMAAAGRAVLAVIDDEGLQANAAKVGGGMLAALKRLRDRYDHVGDVRGRGLMLGIEVVEDSESRRPAPELAHQVHERILHNGVIVGKGGANGNVLRIVPPLCTQECDVERFETALDQAFGASDRR